MIENLNETITQSRPSANENTVKTYERNIRHIMNGLEATDYGFLEDLPKIMDFLSDRHSTTKRNYLNSLIILMMALNSDNRYDELLTQYDKQREALKLTDEPSDRQRENIIEQQELRNMITKIGNDLYGYTKRDLNALDFNLLNVYIVLEILYRFPLRNETLINMKWIRKREYNKLQHHDYNYIVLEKNSMFFCINRNEVEIPKDLDKILRRFYLKSTNDNVFNSAIGKPLTSNGLSQLLIKTSQKYIGKNISSQVIRKIVLSE